MKRLNPFFLFALLCLSLALYGCQGGSETSSNSQDSAQEEKPAPRGTIGVSLLTFDNPFFKVIADNMKAEAEKYGYEVIALSANDDAATQNNQINDLIVQDVSVIVVSPVKSAAIVPAIQAANEANIPVITVDTPCNKEGVEILTQVATDNFEGGEKAAEAMIEALGPDGGKIIVLNKEGSESCELRENGFRKVIDEHNKTAESKIEIVNTLESNGDKAVGLKATEDALQSNPDLAGIFAINDPAALGARAALEKAQLGDEVIIIGFDGQPEGKQAIKEGKIYADPIQYPDKMGIKVIESIVAHFKGEELPPTQYISTSLYRQEDALNDPELK
ncbi:MAG: substrate-binding domain-containing protein [Planctomycetaceae bacterium]|nr:substrate-binding domain-containing protein [Planctomycetaceae bacterium]